MKKGTKIILIILIAVIAVGTLWFSFRRMSGGSSEKSAIQAAEAYAEAVDYQYKDPAAIYAFMTDDFRQSMSEDAFIEAFNKERSYPYLTPLFINFDRVELSEDQMTGTAYYSQAARLPGMVYEVGMVYEDHAWHIRDFDDFLDGSYLDKFDTVTYDLKSYFDTDYPDDDETETPSK